MGMLTLPHQLSASNRKYKILLYGQPGIGKSTIAMSMPNPVVIDTDGGLIRVSPRFRRAPSLQVQNYDQIIALLRSPEIVPYETVIFDTAGRLLDYINEFVIKKDPKNAQGGGQLSIRGWGARSSCFNALISMVSTLGKHVVFVAHDREDKSGDTIKIRPDFGGGKSGAELTKVIDAIGYMQALNGDRRTISFTPNEFFVAKNSANLDPMLYVPDLSEPGSVNDFMSVIISKLAEAATAENIEAQAFSVLMEQINGIVAKVSDEASLELARAEIQGMKHVWHSAQMAENLLQDKADTFGKEKMRVILESVVDVTSANNAIKQLSGMAISDKVKDPARRAFVAKTKKLGLVYNSDKGEYVDPSAPAAEAEKPAPSQELSDTVEEIPEKKSKGKSKAAAITEPSSEAA